MIPINSSYEVYFDRKKSSQVYQGWKNLFSVLSSEINKKRIYTVPVYISGQSSHKSVPNDNTSMTKSQGDMATVKAFINGCANDSIDDETIIQKHLCIDNEKSNTPEQKEKLEEIKEMLPAFRGELRSIRYGALPSTQKFHRNTKP